MQQVKTHKLLVVEDASEVADIIRIAFRRTEVEIYHTENGPSALKFLEHTIPDVLILDIGMPGMSGWDVLEIIRQDERLREIPVIVLTSYTDSNNQRIARQHEVEAFLQKPIDLTELRNTVDKALYLRKG
ncbi:MAG: response regulator [Chloroflexota bacterium]